MLGLSKHEAFWTKKLTWEPLWNRKFGGPGITRFKTLAIFRGRIAFYVLTTPFHSLTCPLRLESSRSCQWLTRLKPKAVRGRWHTPIIFAYIHFNIFSQNTEKKIISWSCGAYCFYTALVCSTRQQPSCHSRDGLYLIQLSLGHTLCLNAHCNWNSGSLGIKRVEYPVTSLL